MLFLLVSMILGHGHHAGHGHSGHGAAHGTGHVIGHTGPGHGGAGHSAGHPGSGRGSGVRPGPGNMSIWSFQMLLLFVGGFGIGGYFASSSLLGLWLTMLIGTAGGLALSVMGYSGINFFYRRQGDSNISSQEYVGLTGIVVTSIRAGAVGQVRCQIGTSRDTFLAQSADGSSIAINSVVRIVEMVGSTAVVEITDPADAIDLPWRN